MAYLGNLKTEAVIAQAAGEIVGCRLRQSFALVVLRDW
jgi:hypothetical protein